MQDTLLGILKMLANVAIPLASLVEVGITIAIIAIGLGPPAALEQTRTHEGLRTFSRRGTP